MKRISEFKKKYKDSLENLMPEDEKEVFINHNVVNVLANRDHKGRRVLLVNVGGKTIDQRYCNFLFNILYNIFLFLLVTLIVF